jgi:glycosyltransferase involved in cell wall biosynthesis
MNLLMISGDRSMLAGKQGAFWYTLEALSKHWDRIDVICPRVDMKGRASGDVVIQEFFGNVFFHPSPYPLRKQHKWIVQRGRQLVNSYRHGVMTVHEYPPFYNGIGARRLSKKTGVPYILEVHHLVGYPVAASFIERIGLIMSRVYLPWAIRRATGTRIVSKATAEVLIKWRTPQEYLRVVPSFYLDRALIASLGDPPPVQYDVAFCGRLVANKGAAALIEAIAHVPRATLLVIGDGPERKNLQDKAQELGIAHRVEFRGWLPTQRDVLRAIQSAKMLVMNSTSEGGPRVPLEAMAAGMPVIVTRVGVMPDVIADGVNGLFTTGTAEDLKEKINCLMQDNELRQRMGAEAVHILDRFERDKLISQYATFMRSFAKRQ